MGLVFVGDWVDEPVSAAPAPDHALDQARRAERARKLLATVEDEMTRFAIIRRFVDGWEYEDIARALGGAVKAGALRTRVCRALEKLRDTSK
jgi:DNA-directed RNA polymerase specialized sigma24 family protein